MCIRDIKPAKEGAGSSGIRCPRCNEAISRVAGFSTPMNLPGEESIRTKMPVRILKIDDGRVKFQSIRQTRVWADCAPLCYFVFFFICFVCFFTAIRAPYSSDFYEANLVELSLSFYLVNQFNCSPKLKFIYHAIYILSIAFYSYSMLSNIHVQDCSL